MVSASYAPPLAPLIHRASLEAEGAAVFYRIFPGLPGALADKAVLDFGCGYGGKAVEYARHASHVAGVEPDPLHVETARLYASERGASNVTFKLCTQDSIPYPDASFDIVVSHDVLEHVNDPSTSLREIARVLKPGGTAYIAFPPYDGAMSHHLDYLTRMPALHWLVPPGLLVRIVNLILRLRPNGTDQQPAPKPSWDGSRKVLPSLNGLTSAQIQELARQYFVRVSVDYRLLGCNHGGLVGTVNKAVIRPLARLGPTMRDRMTGTVAVAAEVSPSD